MKNKKKIGIIIVCIASVAAALSVFLTVNADAIKKTFDDILQDKYASTETDEKVIYATKSQEQTGESKESESVSRPELETEDAEAKKNADSARESIIQKANANQENENKKTKEAADKLNQEIEEYNQKVREHNARLNNFYKNETPEYLVNNVNVHPAYMRYDDAGNLYVAYYITNGFNHTIYDITLQSFSIYTMDGRLIAETGSAISFGEDKGINANAYATQEIVFKGDNLKLKDADLSSIKYTSKVANRY